jgi:hypothetical protein
MLRRLTLTECRCSVGLQFALRIPRNVNVKRNVRDSRFAPARRAP